MNPDAPAAALAGVTAALDALGISWFLTGSIASSLHGVPRSTNDLDVVALLPPASADAFVARLGEAYYADARMIRDAFLHGRACNVISLATMMKIDLMPPRFPHDREAMVRCQRLALDDGQGGSLPVRVATAEDTVLAKLIWWREGGRQSQRQIADIRGVIAAQGAGLDRAYLARWAEPCGIAAELAAVLAADG